jgi:hypothetical protein
MWGVGDLRIACTHEKPERVGQSETREAISLFFLCLSVSLPLQFERGKQRLTGRENGRRQRLQLKDFLAVTWKNPKIQRIRCEGTHSGVKAPSRREGPIPT